MLGGVNFMDGWVYSWEDYGCVFSHYMGYEHDHGSCEGYMRELCVCCHNSDVSWSMLVYCSIFIYITQGLQITKNCDLFLSAL